MNWRQQTATKDWPPVHETVLPYIRDLTFQSNMSFGVLWLSGQQLAYLHEIIHSFSLRGYYRHEQQALGLSRSAEFTPNESRKLDTEIDANSSC